MKITKSNYVAEIANLDVSALPEALQDGYSLVFDATDNYSDWSFFDDKEMGAILDTYFEKLGVHAEKHRKAPISTALRTTTVVRHAKSAKLTAQASKPKRTGMAKKQARPCPEPKEATKPAPAPKATVKPKRTATAATKPAPIYKEATKPAPAPMPVARSPKKSDANAVIRRARGLREEKAEQQTGAKKSFFGRMFKRTKRTIAPVNPQAKGLALLREKDKLAKQIHMNSPVVSTRTIQIREITIKKAQKMAWERLKAAKAAKVMNVRFKK